MSQHLVTCPQCRTRLRSAQPIPVGSSLHCPGCKSSFTAPIATAGRFGAVAIIAVSVAVILGASIILAATLMNRPAAAPVASLHQSEEDAQSNHEARKKELEQERKKIEYTRLILQGEDALRKEQYVVAEEAFSKAADIVPGGTEALKGLVTARAFLATAKKSSEEDGKRQAEIDRLLEEAKKATADKQLAQAVRLLESARTISPTNRSVLDALAAAQLALDADQTQKKTLADFRKLMDIAKAALIAERYTDAVRDFQAALRLMPEDLEAQQGVKQSEAKLAGVADKAKRQVAFDAFVDRGRNSHGAKRYNDAIAALESALRLIPAEREATRLLSGSRDALKQAKSKNAKLLALAEDAMQFRRFEEGQRLASDAVKNWPEDARAEKLLRKATQLLDTARAALTAFTRYMQAGAIATAAKRNADAVAAYTEALRIDPTNAEVMRLLRNANQALARDLKNQADYNRYIQVGAAALNRNSFSDAAKAFQAALKLLPDDAVANDGLSQAKTGLSQARYNRAMSDGQQALRLKQKANAVRAFQAALVEQPDDFAAKVGLQKANALKK